MTEKKQEVAKKTEATKDQEVKTEVSKKIQIKM